MSAAVVKCGLNFSIGIKIKLACGLNSENQIQVGWMPCLEKDSSRNLTSLRGPRTSLDFSQPGLIPGSGEGQEVGRELQGIHDWNVSDWVKEVNA